MVHNGIDLRTFFSHACDNNVFLTSDPPYSHLIVGTGTTQFTAVDIDKDNNDVLPNAYHFHDADRNTIPVSDKSNLAQNSNVFSDYG